MGEDVDNGLLCPGCFDVPGFVLREAAVVQDAKLRVVSRVFQRVGFSSVVKARPPEDSASPGVVSVILPSAFNNVLRLSGAVD